MTEQEDEKKQIQRALSSFSSALHTPRRIDFAEPVTGVTGNICRLVQPALLACHKTSLRKRNEGKACFSFVEMYRALFESVSRRSAAVLSAMRSRGSGAGREAQTWQHAEEVHRLPSTSPRDRNPPFFPKPPGFRGKCV